MPSFDASGLPDPSDHDQPWWDGEPAYLAWWGRLTDWYRSGPSAAVAFWPKFRDLTLLARYAHAVPNGHALSIIASLGPIIDVGAGGGYWARLLRDRGADVIAVDAFAAEDNDWATDGQTWTTVGLDDETAVSRYPDRAVFVSWPPRPNGFMRSLLDRSSERTVALITDGLQTPIDTLHERLVSGWTLTEEVDLPAWPGRSDTLTIWTPRRAPQQRNPVSLDDVIAPNVVGA